MFVFRLVFAEFCSILGVLGYIDFSTHAPFSRVVSEAHHILVG